ncbi:MAG: glycosyltransferase family 9 protein [Pseudomonadota bacterium]
MSDAILVIRLGALGDFVLSTGPFQAIRDAHKDAHIVLLTTAPYEGLAKAGGWFDEVWLDKRPRLWQLARIAALKRQLRGGRFARVYDLQTSDRSSSYYRLFADPKPEWSGIASGASHRQTRADRDDMHTVDRQADQLAVAGIASVPAPDLSMIDADLGELGLPERFAILVPGSAPHRPDKRWAAASYGDLARRLADRGDVPVLLGSGAETDVLQAIAAACPQALNLGGRTTFEQIAAIGRRARCAIGNDTGPMHLLATAGAPSVVLFSAASDPALTAPRGPDVTILQRDTLGDLSVEEVIAVTPAVA